MRKKNEFFIKNSKIARKDLRSGVENVFNKSKVFVAVTEADGHKIIIVGIRIWNKVNDALHKGRKVKLFSLTLGHSICHPEDTFDVNVGVQLAFERALESKRRLNTLSYAMMTDSRCMAIMQEEGTYIKDHLSKYIHCPIEEKEVEYGTYDECALDQPEPEVLSKRIDWMALKMKEEAVAISEEKRKSKEKTLLSE